MSRLAVLERHETDYAADFAAWADEQAAILRGGRFDGADLPNIIEELEGLARTERGALGSQIGRVIEHLLKLMFSPATAPRRGWTESIIDARQQIEDTLEASPSLRNGVEELVKRNTLRKARDVARILREYDGLDRDAERALLAHDFTVEQILDDWFPPAR